MLDLLGWGVSPEYLVDCGLSREIVFYVFTELNLRLPHNLDTVGIMQSISSSAVPQVVSPPLTTRERALSQSQPTMPRAMLSETAPVPEPTPSVPHQITDLHDMERQRRSELLARKAAQLSRKSKVQPPAPVTYVREPSPIPTEDVEMSAAPIEDVDDFLRTIEAEDMHNSEPMDVDLSFVSPESSKSPSMAPSDLEASRIETDLLSPSECTTPSDLTPAVISNTPSLTSNAGLNDFIVGKASASETTRRRGRPVAADFVDSTLHHNQSTSTAINGERSAPPRRGSVNSFAAISASRRCVIDLSDTEDEENTGMAESGTSQLSPSDVKTATFLGGKPQPPASLLQKEIEIQNLRLIIAQKEMESRSKKLAVSHSLIHERT